MHILNIKHRHLVILLKVWNSMLLKQSNNSPNAKIIIDGETYKCVLLSLYRHKVKWIFQSKLKVYQLTTHSDVKGQDKVKNCDQ